MGFLGRLFGGKKTSSPSSSSSSSSSQPKPTNKKNKTNKNNKKLWRFIRSLNLTNNNTRLALPYHPHNNNNNNHPHNAVPLPLNLPLPHGGHIDNSSNSNSNMDPNKHAIAVAVATAAVAEAALVAAQAAAEVVRLTSAGGGGGGGSHALLLRKESAAVKIQSAFRAYLARRALRALRALVKLQALARGFLVRKQMADMLKRMQTLVQVQARARASRSGSSSSSSLHSTSKSSSHRPRYNSHANPGGLFDTDKTRLGSNLLDLYMDESMWNRQRDIPGRNIHDDEKSAKVLEVDTWKPHSFSPQKNRNFKTKNHAFTSDNIGESFRAFDSPSKRSMNIWNLSKEYPRVKDDLSRYAENIPQFAPVSSRPGSSSCRREQPFSPTRSEASWGYFSGYSGHPNYMTNTESSRAKVRSQSAPKQRIEFDRTGSAKRSLQGSWDYSEMENGFSLHSDYWNKTYLGASHLNGHGRPELR